MQIGCPHCGHRLSYSDTAPRFYSNCGRPMGVGSDVRLYSGMISPPEGVTMPQNTVGLVDGARMRTLPSARRIWRPRDELALGRRGSQSAIRGRTWNVLPPWAVVVGGEPVVIG